MSMSRKDFEAIAQALHLSKAESTVIETVADLLAERAPSFNRERFVEASEQGLPRRR